jgi:hypothetical protein
MPGPLNFSGFFCKLLNLNECVLLGPLNFSGPRFLPQADRRVPEDGGNRSSMLSMAVESRLPLAPRDRNEQASSTCGDRAPV